MDLKVYLDSTIPENIKRIELVQKCTDIFAMLLNANSSISFKINKLFDIDSESFIHQDSNGNYNEISFYEHDSEGYQYKHVLEARDNLKKGLFYTYLSVMFNLLEIVCSNPDVIEILKKRNFPYTKLTKNPYDIIDSEYFSALKYFQINSGTEQAIRYIYQFSRYLETGEADNSLELDSGDPFYLEYRGELHKSIFSDFNHPLAHPCGWCFRYDTIIRLLFEDWFGIKINYHIRYVIAYKDSKRIYFGRPTPGLSANVCMPEDIENFEECFNGINTLVVPLDILSVTDNEIQFNGYVLSEDKYLFLNNFRFPNGWHLQPIDKSQMTLEIEYKDEFYMEDTLEISKDYNSMYYVENFNNAFKLSGDPYPFTPGIDESVHKANANNLLEMFTLTIPYRIQNLTYLSLEDDFGHKFARVLEKGSELKVRTHGFYGNFITFRALDGLSYNYDHYLRANILNAHNSTVKISGFSIKGNHLKFTAKSSLSTLSIKISVNGNNFEYQSGPIKNIDLDTSSYPNFCDFNIEITDFNDTLEISGNGINNTNENFYFGFPYYPDGNLVSLMYTNCTPKTMGDNPNGFTLGQLNRCIGQSRNSQGINENPDNVSELNYKNHSGICYINKGFDKVLSESTDCFNTACTKYAEDSFVIGSSGYDTYLTFTNPEIDGSNGKFLVCRYNNDPQESIVRGLLIGYILLFNTIE